MRVTSHPFDCQPVTSYPFGQLSDIVSIFVLGINVQNSNIFAFKELSMSVSIVVKAGLNFCQLKPVFDERAA